MRDSPSLRTGRSFSGSPWGRLEGIAIRLEAIAIRLEAIAIRVEAIAIRLEAIAIRVEAIASRFSLGGHASSGSAGRAQTSALVRTSRPMKLMAQVAQGAGQAKIGLELLDLKSIFLRLITHASDPE